MWYMEWEGQWGCVGVGREEITTYCQSGMGFWVHR